MALNSITLDGKVHTHVAKGRFRRHETALSFVLTHTDHQATVAQHYFVYMPLESPTAEVFQQAAIQPGDFLIIIGKIQSTTLYNINGRDLHLSVIRATQIQTADPSRTTTQKSPTPMLNSHHENASYHSGNS